MLKNVKLLSLAGALVLGVGVMACGGGGGGDDNNSSTGTDPTVAVDGFIKNAVATCVKADASEEDLSGTTDENGQILYDQAAKECVTIKFSPKTDGTTIDMQFLGSDGKEGGGDDEPFNMTLIGSPPVAGSGVAGYASPLSTALNGMSDGDRATFLGSLGISASDVNANPYASGSATDTTKKLLAANTFIAMVFKSVVDLANSAGGGSTLSSSNYQSIMASVTDAVKGQDIGALLDDLASGTSVTETLTTVLNTTISGLTAVLANTSSMTTYVSATAGTLSTSASAVVTAISESSDLSESTLFTTIGTAASASETTVAKVVTYYTTGEGKDKTATEIETELAALANSGDIDEFIKDVNDDVTPTIVTKGFACADNMVSIGGVDAEYGGDGAVGDVTGVDGNDLSISCELKGYTNSTGTAVNSGTATYTASVSLYVKDVSLTDSKRMAKATIYPVTITVTGDDASSTPTASSVSISTSATMTLSGTDSTGGTLTATTSYGNVTSNSISMANGVLTVDVNSFLDRIQEKTGLEVSIDSGSTVDYEVGITGFTLGTINSTDNGLDALVLSGTSTNVSGVALGGSITLQ